jgi:hypothetical protein
MAGPSESAGTVGNRQPAGSGGTPQFDFAKLPNFEFSAVTQLSVVHIRRDLIGRYALDLV